MIVSVQLDSYIGVDNFLDKRKEFKVSEALDLDVILYIQKLNKMAQELSDKWMTNNIDDSLYVSVTVDGKESGSDYHKLNDYLDSL